MPEPALRADVIAALKAQNGVGVEVLADGSVEVSAVGQPIRRFPFGKVVNRTLVHRLSRWYGAPIATFFPPASFKPKTEASGQ